MVEASSMRLIITAEILIIHKASRGVTLLVMVQLQYAMFLHAESLISQK